MSVDKEKKFVIKHVFNDVLKLERGKIHNFQKQNHLNVDWHIAIYMDSSVCAIHLICSKIAENCSIEAKIDLKLRNDSGEERSISEKTTFSPEVFQTSLLMMESQLMKYLVDGNLTIEFEVEILKMTGKMFDDSNKEFSLKHVFTDVLALEQEKYYESPIENHFNVDWNLSILLEDGWLCVYLKCAKIAGNNDYEIGTESNGKVLKARGKDAFFHDYQLFFPKIQCERLAIINNLDFKDYLIDGNLTVECHVKIVEMDGIEKPSAVKTFDASNKKFSDVVLIMEDKKFHVMKQYLASHSSYFKALFYGDFEDSKQSEVELKDIDPEDFQNYLDVIHGESLIEESTVEGILILADFFDSKTAIKRCEEFLLKYSNKSPAKKFELAKQYKLENLLEKYHPGTKENLQDIRRFFQKI